MDSNTTLLEDLSISDLRELLNEPDEDFGCPIIFKAKFWFAAGFFVVALTGKVYFSLKNVIHLSTLRPLFNILNILKKFYNKINYRK